MRSSSYVGVKYENFTSFLISLCIYFLAGFFLLFNAIRDHELALKYTDDPNAYMDIIVDREIDDSAPKAPELAKETPAEPQVEEKPKEIEKIEEPKPEPLPEPKPVETPIEEPKPEPKPNLNDLFADTTKDNKKLQESTEKKEEKQESGSKNAVQKSDKKSGKSQLTGKYEKFRGGVKKRLLILWARYTAGTVAEDATFRLTIDTNGKVIAYEITRLSYNSEFNRQVRDFMERLLMEEFPKPPETYTFTDLNLNIEE